MPQVYRSNNPLVLEADKSKVITNKNKMKMETPFIKNLMSQLFCAVLNTETQPITTENDCPWQNFKVCNDTDAADLAAVGIETRGVVYESGTVEFVMLIKPSENARDAYKRLKAKNMVLISIERAEDAKRAEDESTKLLEKAADMLGITPAQALEMVK